MLPRGINQQDVLPQEDRERHQPRQLAGTHFESSVPGQPSHGAEQPEGQRQQAHECDIAGQFEEARKRPDPTQRPSNGVDNRRREHPQPQADQDAVDRQRESMGVAPTGINIRALRCQRGKRSQV